MSNPYIAVSELTNVIYIVDGKKKYDVTKEVMGAVILTHRAIPIEKLEQIRAEIANYGTMWVEYKIVGHRDKDIDQIVEDVLKQAKKQVLEVIDKAMFENGEVSDGTNI